jgi:nicotinate-nucleotide pyrophosphorylase (carboxylating)
MLPWVQVDPILTAALREDNPYIDISAAPIFPTAQAGQAYLCAKEDGVCCGLAIFARVFTLLDPAAQYTPFFKDGDAYKKGDKLAQIHAPTVVLLQGERTALNILQHLCGIATATAKATAQCAGTRAAVADTRKTLPGLRALQKYAVRCGGGRNHRLGLSDAVMLKNNHIDACGSIAAAAARVRANIGHMVKLEIETRNLEEVAQALQANADVIMLDNMSLPQIQEAVTRIRAQKSHTVIEISGNVTLQNLRDYAETGADVISMGCLTHSVHAADISMRVTS